MATTTQINNIIFVIGVIITVLGVFYGHRYMKNRAEEREKEKKLRLEEHLRSKQQAEIDAKLKKQAEAAEKKRRIAAIKNKGMKRKTTVHKKKKKEDIPEDAIGAIKTHTEKVTSVSTTFQGQKAIVATGSEDGTVRIFDLDTLVSTKQHIYFRHQCPIVGDYPTSVCLSDSGSKLAYSTAEEKQVILLLVPPIGQKEKKPTVLKQFPTGHKATVSKCVFATTGAKDFVVTCTNDTKDTSLKFFNKPGKLLQSVDTKTIVNKSLSVSADSRFVAAISKTTTVKVYEVQREKDGIFKKVVSAYVVQGHEMVVNDAIFGFYPHGMNTIVSGSKNSVKIWDTDVRFDLGAEPTQTASFPHAALVVAVSPDLSIIAVANSSELVFLRAKSASTHGSSRPSKSADAILAKHSLVGGTPLQLSFAKSGKIVILHQQGAKHVSVWNVPRPAKVSRN